MCELGWGDTRRLLLELRGQTDPETEPVLGLVLLARACNEGGDAAGAREVLRRAVVARPDQVVLHGALGGLLERQGREAEAIECYQAARALRPELGVALGRALAKAGRAVDAEVVCREMVRQQPSDSGRHFFLGLALYDQRKLAKAVASYREAIRLQPHFPNAYTNMGIALADQGQVAEAIAAHREAIRLRSC
jgi:superkiller protein 3